MPQANETRPLAWCRVFMCRMSFNSENKLPGWLWYEMFTSCLHILAIVKITEMHTGLPCLCFNFNSGTPASGGWPMATRACRAPAQPGRSARAVAQWAQQGDCHCIPSKVHWCCIDLAARPRNRKQLTARGALGAPPRYPGGDQHAAWCSFSHTARPPQHRALPHAPNDMPQRRWMVHLKANDVVGHLKCQWGDWEVCVALWK